MLIFVCTFLGGIALFLYGMQLMGDGLQKAAGAKLQQFLAALTGVLAMGVVVGAVVTALLQSSSATTVMTVGLVNAGLLTLKQAFGIVMGANIQFNNIGVGNFILVFAPKHIGFAVVFDQRYLCFGAVTFSHVFQRFIIDWKIGNGTAKFRRHVSDGCAVRNGEICQTRTKNFYKFSDDAKFSQQIRNG